MSEPLNPADWELCRHDLLKRHCAPCLSEAVASLTQRLGEVEVERSKLNSAFEAASALRHVAETEASRLRGELAEALVLVTDLLKFIELATRGTATSVELFTQWSPLKPRAGAFLAAGESHANSGWKLANERTRQWQAAETRLAEARGLLRAHDPGQSSATCVNAGTFPSQCAWKSELGVCWEHRRRAFLASGPGESQPTLSLVTTTTGPTCERCSSLVLGDGRCGNCREWHDGPTVEVVSRQPPKSSTQGCGTCGGTRWVLNGKYITGNVMSESPCPDCSPSEPRR